MRRGGTGGYPAMHRSIWISTVFAILAFILVGRIPLANSSTEEWQPVSPEDLALKDNPASPGSDAMILYREDFVNEKYADIDGPYVDEYMRIKIFTEKGKKWGDVEIEFDKDNSNIADLKARTILPDGSIVNFEGKPFEKTVEKASGYQFLAKTFTMPGVTPGCIIEYRYRRQYHPQFLYDEHWTVSQELFTREAHFSITPYIPHDYYDYYPLYFRLFHLPASSAPKMQRDGTYTMTVQNIPGIEDEPLTLPRRELEARVEFFHRDQDAPSNETADHFWARTGKKWDDNLERFINKKSALQKDLAQTVSAGDPPEVKLEKIYARVEKIRNLSYEETRSASEMKKEKLKEETNVEDLLKNGYGYGTQIDYLFIGLARAAGFDATSVFVAPPNVNVFYPQMQDPREIDDDIVWVSAGGKEYFLDPSAMDCPFPMLPWFETSTQGVRVSKQGGQIVQTPDPKPSDAVTVRTADLQIDDQGNASGTVSVDWSGYRAIDYRILYRKDDDAGRKKELQDLLQNQLAGGANITITKIDDWGDITKPIHVEATVKASGFATTMGHRLLVPSLLFREMVVKDFEAQKRSNDIYFSYPYEVSDTVTIHAPPGFSVESLPPAKAQNPGVITYDFTPVKQGNLVVTKRHLIEAGMLYEEKFYFALRAFFNSVKSNDDSEIVFQSGTNKGD